MKVVSLFTGIGGFDVGADAAGMRVVAQVERDPVCHSVLKRHWPASELFTDVRNFSAKPFRPDLICGGFPCQDLSVAGRRAGLAGERSGLWFEFRRILEEATPRWVCIENVPGLLSSNRGGDLSVVLSGLADLGYGWAMRVFDSQWFGVAQRRRRVFIVGHLGSVRRAGEILFEPDCLPWDSPPSREERPRVAALTSRGVGTCGADDNQAQAGHLIAFGGNRTSGAIDVATACNTKDRQDFETETLITFTRSHIRNSTDDADIWKESQITGALTAEPLNGIPGHSLSAIAFQERGRPEGRTIETQGDLAYCLTAPKDGGRGQEKCVAYQATCYRECTYKEVEQAGPITTGTDQSRGTPVIASPAYGVRRLTPRECERLQGFSDDWTRWTHDSKEIKDSPRYRMLGNAVTCDVAKWIFKRIARRIVAAEHARD